MFFRRCVSLAGIIIPDKITTIEDSIFADCKSLTWVVWGESINTVAGGAFQCPLEEVYYKGTNFIMALSTDSLKRLVIYTRNQNRL